MTYILGYNYNISHQKDYNISSNITAIGLEPQELKSRNNI